MKKQKWIIRGTWKSEPTEETFFGTENQVQKEVSRLMTLPYVDISEYEKVKSEAMPTAVRSATIA